MKDRIRGATVWTLMALCACSAPAATVPASTSPTVTASTSPTVTAQPRDETTHPRQPYTLVPPARPAAADPLPPGFRYTQARYEEARQAYEKGAFKQAAAGFIQAAASLAIMKVKPYGDIAAANRAVFYLDAAYAWAMAGMVDKGLQRLADIREQGFTSGEMLERAFAVLRSLLPADLTRAMIAEGIRRVTPNVMYCGIEFRVSGNVKIRLQVSTDGTVANVTVLEAPDAALGACAAQATRKAKFARTRNGGTFSYPWVFPPPRPLNDPSSQQLICAHETENLRDFVEFLDRTNRTISKPWPTGDAARDHHVDEVVSAFQAAIKPEEQGSHFLPLMMKNITPGELERLYGNCPASLASLGKVDKADPDDIEELWYGAIDGLMDCQCRADLPMLKVFYYLIYRGPY
jgi:TonB family protein